MTGTGNPSPTEPAGSDPDVPPGVDITKPSSARIYDYFLGGTNNFPVDRQVAEKLRVVAPDTADAFFANRGFHGRAAVWMAKRGIRQFLDLGSGLPTQNNTHESVHRVSPDARVAYVDIDPMVAAHAGTLLAGDGTTTVITADLREPDVVLSRPELRQLIDFAEPVGVLLTSVLHFISDDENPWGLVARYMSAVAPGSYLAVSHVTHDNMPPRTVRSGLDSYAAAADHVRLRSKAEVLRFFDGLELESPYEGAEPGLSYPGLWDAVDLREADSDGSRGYYCGVARRPAGFGGSGERATL